MLYVYVNREYAFALKYAFVHIERKSIYCRYVLHNRHGQSGFHFLIDLKPSKQEHSSIFPGAKTQTFGAKKKIVSVPCFTVLGVLLES